jgi:hypothetical protein
VDNGQEERERHWEEGEQKLCFEGCKEMATLSLIAAGVILAIYRAAAVQDFAVVVALVLFGLSAIVSVGGLVVVINNFNPTLRTSTRRPGTAGADAVMGSVCLFVAGLISFMVGAFDLPNWTLLVFAVVAFSLFQLWWRGFRSRIRLVQEERERDLKMGCAARDPRRTQNAGPMRERRRRAHRSGPGGGSGGRLSLKILRKLERNNLCSLVTIPRHE